MLHANVQFIGEMIAALGRTLSTDALLELANESYSLAWTSRVQIDVRAAWLRSAGLLEKTHDGLRATSSGVSFVAQVDIYEPLATNAPAKPRRTSDASFATEATSSGPPLASSATDDSQPSARPPQARLPQGESPTTPDAATTLRAAQPRRSSHDSAAQIGGRLVSLSCDGPRHKEFEVAVRDAFDFLGFDAQHLSGPGQTDVLLTGLRVPQDAPPGAARPWSYRVAVDAKASSSGKLADLQVTWPALAMHRQHHEAEFSLLVGPSPRARLLQFAMDASVAVLAADDLAKLCRRHAQVPLPAAAYRRLFSGDDGQPCGGRVDPARIEDSRQGEVRRRELLARVVDATTEIAANFGPANQQLVRFKLSEGSSADSGAPSTGSEIDEVLGLLASPWLHAAAQVGAEAAEPHYVPTAPARFVAQRLRWLADAFDGETDDDGASLAESG